MKHFVMIYDMMRCEGFEVRKVNSAFQNIQQQQNYVINIHSPTAFMKIALIYSTPAKMLFILPYFQFLSASASDLDMLGMLSSLTVFPLGFW